MALLTKDRSISLFYVEFRLVLLHSLEDLQKSEYQYI
jgi:hypothetical protein